jgi:Leucine-rich repeat (LRR) protein
MEERLTSKLTRRLNCSYNSLKSLNLTRNLRSLDCSYNLIAELKLNKKLEDLSCARNCLKSLKCNKKLKALDCRNNFLTELELNDGLEYLDCSDNNELTSIKYIPSTLKELYCYGINFDVETQLRIIKCNYIEPEGFVDNYKRYLVLLLGLEDSYILKYLKL